MTTIFSYIRIFIFLGGTLASVQVPLFVDQYGKSLEAHFLEAENALNEFQDDANKYFDGNIEALIAHYKQSGDKVFNDGGTSIQSLLERYLFLKKNFTRFTGSQWQAYVQALFTPVAEVQEEVWHNFSYALILEPRSLLFGLVAGLLLASFVEVVLRLLVLLGGGFFSRNKKPAGALNKPGPKGVR